MTRIVVIGRGGHARMLASILWHQGKVEFITDDEVQEDDKVVVGVGNLHGRIKLFEKFKSQIIGVKSSDSIIHRSFKWGIGVQVAAGALIQNDVEVGDNVLINTGAQVDHDCTIGTNGILAPRSVLCGNVRLGDDCQIGAGAIIVQGVELEAGTIIPAGSLVVEQDHLCRPQRVVSAREGSSKAGATGVV